MKKKICYLFLLWANVAFMILCGCTSEPEFPLTIGTSLWLGYEPLNLARDLDMVPDGEYKFLEYSSASEVSTAFRNGAVDVAAVTLDEAVLLVQGGADVAVILALDFSNGADAMIGASSLSSLKELRGKTIGLERSTIGEYFLSLILKSVSLQRKDIKIVQYDFNHHESAFLNKEVDALITYEPTLTKLKKKGAVVVTDSKSYPKKIIDVLIVQREMLSKKQAPLAKLIRAWDRVVRYINTHPALSLEKMSRRTKLTAKDLEHALSGVKFLSMADNSELLGARKAILPIAEEIRSILIKENNGSAGKIETVQQMFSSPADWYQQVGAKIE